MLVEVVKKGLGISKHKCLDDLQSQRGPFCAAERLGSDEGVMCSTKRTSTEI